MNKKRIAIGFFLLTLLSVVLVVSAVRKRPPQEEGREAFITPPPIRPSTMPHPISGDSITYSGEPQLSFPSNVPYYRISRHKDFGAERDRLLALYNITSPPETIIGSKGRYISFTGKGESGLLSENPLTLTVRSATQSGRFITNDLNRYRASITEALADLSMLPRFLTPVVSTQRFFSFDEPHPTELTSPEGALVTQLDVSVTLETLPVFINDADSPVFSVSFDGDDSLIEFRGSFLPDVTKETGAIIIVSYDEAVKRLKENAGILSSIALTQAGEREFMTGNIPLDIEIEAVVLGYLYSTNQDYLVPVFVFTGSANEPGSAALLRTTTIVSAL